MWSSGEGGSWTCVLLAWFDRMLAERPIVHQTLVSGRLIPAWASRRPRSASAHLGLRCVVDTDQSAGIDTIVQWRCEQGFRRNRFGLDFVVEIRGDRIGPKRADVPHSHPAFCP